MPNVNLDKQVSRPTWNFSITYGGKTYATRRPSLQQMRAMASAKAGEPQQIIETLNELFERPGPDVGTWPIDAVMRFVRAFTEYIREDQRRCGLLDRSAAAAAVARVRTSPLN